jgi:hypothetical protein
MAEKVETVYGRLRRLAAEANLPGIEESTSYGNPALKVGGKTIVAVKDSETVVLSISIDDKERLIEMAPEIYYQTDHYVGWPHLPLRIDVIADAELKERLIGAWLFRAPKKLAAGFRR